MAVGARSVRLGRLRAVSILSSLQESVGDTLETIGGGVVAGDRRPRPFNLELPVRGVAEDGDAAAAKLAGERLRRQIRSLMDNTRVKLEGLYFHSLGDHELSGWLVVGGGHVEQVGQAALARGEWKLVLQDCFRVGSAHTHRDARRVELLDRRLASSPRDIRGQVYATDFAAEEAVAATIIPPGYRMVMSRHGSVAPLSLATIEGSLGLVIGSLDGEVLQFEMREGMRHHADVVLHDRRGITTIAPPLRTNLHTNPSVEEVMTGWTTGGTNALVREGGAEQAAHSGHWGMRATYSNNLLLASWAATLTAAQHVFSVYVKIPHDWNGGQIQLDAASFAGSSGEVAANADMGIRGTWQRLSVTVTIAGGDLVGAFELRAASAPTAGRYIRIDSAQIEAAAAATAYFDGDSRFCRWTGTEHASTAQSYGDPEDFGWEEVMGENWPLYDHMDPPVMSNGVCRVRLVPGLVSLHPVFAIDAFITGTGWVEQARVYAATSGGFTYTAGVLAAHVIEWTPERAVLHVHTARSGSNLSADLFITLQRGWSAPRFELYAHDLVGSPNPAAQLLVAPFDSGAAAFLTGEPVATNPAAVLATTDPGAVQGLIDTLLGTWEPWILLNPLAGTARAVAVAVAVSAEVDWVEATNGYDALRRTLSVYDGLAGSGYTSIALHLLPRQPLLEAEAATRAGNVALVADANAAPGTGNSAVESTETAEPAVDNLNWTSGAVGADAVGSQVAVWARVRVVTGGATGTLRFRFGSTAYAAAVTFTSATYVWIRCGEQERAAADDLDLRLWRSAGTGAVRIDRVIVVTLERRSIASAKDYAGVRDHAERSLYDARQIPDIVSR